MKVFFSILLSFFCLSIHAQTINFKIDGVVDDTKNAKFAYLTTLSQQTTISSDKLFIRVPIVNGKFEFNGSFNLQDKNFQQACLFFDERGNITKDELALKFKNLIWVTGRDPHLLRIILETLSLHAKNRAETNKATITKNGTLTKQFHECIQATKSDTPKELANLIKKYPNSPISLMALERIPLFDKNDIKELNISLPILFYSLSTKIKASKEGLAIKKKLNIH